MQEQWWSFANPAAALLGFRFWQPCKSCSEQLLALSAGKNQTPLRRRCLAFVVRFGIPRVIRHPKSSNTFWRHAKRMHPPACREPATAQDRPEDADAGGRSREARDKVKAGGSCRTVQKTWSVGAHSCAGDEAPEQ